MKLSDVPSVTMQLLMFPLAVGIGLWVAHEKIKMRKRD